MAECQVLRYDCFGVGDVASAICGVDPNEFMTDYAIEFRKIKSDRVRYESLRGLSENLPFEDGSVDVAVVSLVLCSVEDQLASLKEVKLAMQATDRQVYLCRTRIESNERCFETTAGGFDADANESCGWVSIE